MLINTFDSLSLSCSYGEVSFYEKCHRNEFVWSSCFGSHVVRFWAKLHSRERIAMKCFVVRIYARLGFCCLF